MYIYLQVCDEEMRIRFVDAKHAGACHDSLIWKVSEFRSHLLQRYLGGERNFWLLGKNMCILISRFIIIILILGDAGYGFAPSQLTILML